MISEWDMITARLELGGENADKSLAPPSDEWEILKRYKNHHSCWLIEPHDRIKRFALKYGSQKVRFGGRDELKKRKWCAFKKNWNILLDKL